MTDQPTLPPVPEMGSKLFPQWMLEVREWLLAVHAWVQTIERTQEDPLVSELQEELGDEQERSARQAELLHRRLCQCCGHIDGVCPSCSMPHRQATEGGCLLCVQASDVPPAISGEPS